MTDIIELIRLREMRTAVMDLVELMKHDGWLDDDSEAASDLDAAFLKLYGEFNERYFAEQIQKERDDLFNYGKAKSD